MKQNGFYTADCFSHETHYRLSYYFSKIYAKLPYFSILTTTDTLVFLIKTSLHAFSKKPVTSQAASFVEQTLEQIFCS